VTPQLTFLGAAGTVTGSKFLLESNGARVLLECGLFQGAKSLQERNWTPPVQASTLQAVLLSHAHIDHSGYLPRLVRDGFDGSIFCSPATADLIGIMLPDAARLSEEEAEFRNRTGATRHQPALPLFTEADATRALGLVRRVAFGDAFTPAPGVTARLSMSGHILGASVVQVTTAGRRLVYSGDLGRYGVAVMRDPDPVSEADTLVIESTYGNRLHPSDDGRPILVEAVQRAVSRRGILLVPAFAVGRTQELLFLIAELETAGQIPRLDVYLDSPMAAAANAIFSRPNLPAMPPFYTTPGYAASPPHLIQNAAPSVTAGINRGGSLWIDSRRAIERDFITKEHQPCENAFCWPSLPPRQPA